MPHRTVYEANIQHLQILDEDGKLDKALAKDTLTDDQVAYLYEQMRICRELDEIAWIPLSQTGELDLPAITRFVLGEVKARVDGKAHRPVPFVRFVRGKHDISYLD